jgi:hypothetical protein
MKLFKIKNTFKFLTDLKFAINCKFHFRTPEIFFKLDYDKKDTCYVKYPIIYYYDKLQQNNLFLKIFKLIENKMKNNKILITMIGLPGSGKSFFRKILLEKFNNFYYTNNDDINNKINNKKLLTISNLENIGSDSTSLDYLINDNTNISSVIASNLSTTASV